MKKLAIAVTAVAAFTGSAIAADMPVKAPLAPVVRAMSWTGCYVGAGGGYAFSNSEITTFTDPGGILAGQQQTSGGRGVFGTAQVGCDYQVMPSWLVGAFGDYDFSSIKGVTTVPNFAFQGEEKQRSAWAAGGRIGYLLTPKLLTFASVGYTQARYNQIDLFNTANGAPTGFDIAAHTYSGYFVGTGYEYALDWFPNLFWKTEYRFSEFHTDRNSVLVTATGGLEGFAVDQHKYTHAVRSELVWRFWTR